MTQYIPLVLIWIMFTAGVFGWRRAVEENRKLKLKVLQLEAALDGRKGLYYKLFNTPHLTPKDLEN